MFSKRIILALLCITSLTVNMIQAQGQSCVTPVGENGSCTPIRKCSFTKQLVDMPKPYSEAVKTYLKQSFCQVNERRPYVCCAARHQEESPVTTTTTTAMPDADDFPDVSDHVNLPLIMNKNCGRVNGDKISNGNITRINQYPFMALLGYRTQNRGIQYFCGGSIISDRYILTAAHCLKLGSKLVQVRIGEHNRGTDPDCEFDFDEQRNICTAPVQNIDVEEIIEHPRFNRPERAANDIALLRLAKKISFKEKNARPICLPHSRTLASTELQNVTITGWGYTEKSRIQSEALLQAIVPIVQPAECQKRWGNGVRLRSTQMCAGGVDYVDHCNGDSGGPLFYATQYVKASARNVQFGIVSAGVVDECGADDRHIPGIYTRVVPYMQWILDQMKV